MFQLVSVIHIQYVSMKCIQYVSSKNIRYLEVVEGLVGWGSWRVFALEAVYWVHNTWLGLVAVGFILEAVQRTNRARY